MNDLKDSNETLKQTTDQLKQQQTELKDMLDMLNGEKDDWVHRDEGTNSRPDFCFS